jgi:O-antigen/teichoic acid export membrane protein
MTLATTSSVAPAGKLSVTVGKGTFFGVFASLVQIATRFVTVPIIISHLGLGGYGIWNILMAIAAYMRFGSVGIKSAYQKYVAEATGTGNFQAANRLLSTGAAVMLALSIFCLIPVAIFSKKLATVAGIPPGFLHSSAGAITMFALFMVFANWGGVYEGIVMGGHRIDLLRKLGPVLSVAEAVAIIIAVRLGYGLFAMATVMTASEMVYILFCMVMSRRIVPPIHVGKPTLSKGVLYELLRFGGSYQLVNILEILYLTILPVAILRAYGDTAAGIYALVYRVVTSALILHDAFMVPMLSGSTTVFASGSQDRMRSMLTKSFKASIAIALPPLAFAAWFGPLMVAAWTGQTSPLFRGAFMLVCLSTFFGALSLLQLVLYRASGNALMDNLRQVLRIVTLLVVTLFATKIGFFGVLAGLAFSNFLGMVFMFWAMEAIYHCFETKMLIPNALKIMAATAIIIGAGVLAGHLPLGHLLWANPRGAATLRLAVVAFGCLAATWPALILTRTLTPQEVKTLVEVVLPTKRTIPPHPAAEGAVE